MDIDVSEELAQAAVAFDLLPTLLRLMDPPDDQIDENIVRELGEGFRRICADAGQQLLQADPATAPDDAILASQAVLAGEAVVDELGRAGAAELDDDLLLAWATYAYAVGTRLFGPASNSALRAGNLLVRVRERRREFAEAIQLRRARTALAIVCGEPHASRAMVAYARTLHHAGHCAKAADMLAGTWQDWQHEPGRDRDGLHIVMHLVVLLAACGRTRDALQQLAAAVPYRPTRPFADRAYVQLRYGHVFAEQRDAHRRDCTWPANPTDPDVDWPAVLAASDPTAEPRP